MRAQRESWILLLIGILSCFTVTRSQTDDILTYSFNVTIVNRYGKDIKIITTHPNPMDKQFPIPLGKSYQIISTHSSSVNMYITAYDEKTFAPLTVNGQVSQVVIASDKPVSYVFFVPTAPTEATVSTEEPYRPPDTKSDDITTVSPTDPALATQRSTNHAVTKTIAPTKGLTTQDPTERAVTTKNQTDDAVSRKASTKDITTEDPTDSVVGTKNATYDPVITKASTDGRTTENPTQPVVASTKLTEHAVVTKADDPTDVVASKQGPINNGVLTEVSIDETIKNPTTTGDSTVADGGAPTEATVSTEEPYRPPDTKSDDITTVSPTDPALATQRSTNHAVTKTIAPTKGLTTQDPTERAVTTKNQTDDAVSRKASTKDITTEDPTDSVVGTKNATYDPVITKASTDGRTTENPTQPVVASTKLTEHAVVTKADDPTDVVASKQGPINNGVLTEVSIDETIKNPTTTGDSTVADGGDAVGGCRNDKMLIAVIIVLAIFLAAVSVAVIALFCRVLKTKTKKKNDTIYSGAQKNEIDTIL